MLVGVLERQGMIAANADKKCEGKWTRVMEVKNKNEVNVEKAVLDYIMLPSKDRNMISKVVVEESVDVESDHNLVWVELDIRYKEDILIKRKVEKWKIEELCKKESLYYNDISKMFEGWKDEVGEWRKEVVTLGRTVLVEKVWSSFKSKILGVMEETVGEKIVRERAKEWWNKELNLLCKEKAELYRQMRVAEKDGKDREYSFVKVKYQEKRRENKRCIKKSRRRKVDEFVEVMEKDRVENPKLFASNIRKMSGKKSSLPQVVEWKGKEVEEKEDIAEAWAGFFERLGVEDRKDNYQETFKSWVDVEVREMGEERMYQEELDGEFNEEEIVWGMKNLKNGKAGGIDGLIKYGGSGMMRALMLLFNVIWKVEMVPDDWKRGAIFPIYKNKGARTDIGNYRGITLLSVVGKMFEAIINKRMSKWIERRGLLSDQQGGFRVQRGCPDSYYLLHETLSFRKELKLKTYACFIDVKKAYDTVWQNGLWKRLWDIGIKGKTWRIIREWYQGMQSCVLLDGDATRYFDLEQGVKQGAVLSPLLYAIFVDGVVDALKKKQLGVTINGEWLGMMMYAVDWHYLLQMLKSYSR